VVRGETARDLSRVARRRGSHGRGKVGDVGGRKLECSEVESARGEGYNVGECPSLSKS